MRRWNNEALLLFYKGVILARIKQRYYAFQKASVHSRYEFHDSGDRCSEFWAGPKCASMIYTIYIYTIFLDTISADIA